MELRVGQIVISKAGRDKGDVFVVYAVDGIYALLVDGKGRPLANPKRKKRMHIQPTLTVDGVLAEKIAQNAYLLDADFRKVIKNFRSSEADKRQGGGHIHG